MAEDTHGSAAKAQELKERLDKDPGSRVFLQLAEEYRKLGRFEDAILVCHDGLRRNPGYTTARVTLARAYLGAKKLDDAKAEFEKVIAAVPDNILANRYLGDLYYDEGRSEEALARYRVVRMLSPDDEEVGLRVARLEGRGSGVRPRPAPIAEAVAGSKPMPVEFAPPATADTGDELAGFMDLKIDESVILNADMIAAALGSRPEARPPAAAPANPAPPPSAATATPVSAPDEFGEMGADDFSDFSSPTVMLTAADLAAIPGVRDEPAEPTPVAKPAPVEAPPPAAVPRSGEVLASFAARSAQKFGLSKYAGEAQPPAPAPPTVAAAPPAAAPPPQPVAPPLPVSPAAAAGASSLDTEQVGEMGLDDFSEFAAPTVMMNVRDLVSAGVLGPSEAAPPPASAPLPVPPPGASSGAEDATSDWAPLPEAASPFGEATDFGPPPFETPAAGADLPLSDAEAETSWAMPPAEPDPVAAAPAAPVFGTLMIPRDELPAAVTPGPPPGDMPPAPAAVAGVGAPVEQSEDELSGRTLANLYFQQGHLEKALAIYERYLERNPADDDIRRRVEDIRSRLRPPSAVAAATPVAAPAGSAAGAPGTGGEVAPEERKKKIERLSNWLSALKKK